MTKKIILSITSIVVGISLIGCSSVASIDDATNDLEINIQKTEEVESNMASVAVKGSSESVVSWVAVEGGIIDTSNVFTERDLTQTYDTNSAQIISPVNGQDVTITKAGVYMLSGSYEDVTLVVETAVDAKVQLILDGYHVSNDDAPAIYIKSGDKVFVTTTETENTLSVTGSFLAEGDINLDAVIFAKSELVLNGLGTINIASAKGNAVSSKDDLVITGGTYVVSAKEDGFESNDGLYIFDGSFNVTVEKDAFHSENDEDSTVGEIYIHSGNFIIDAGDDAIQGTTKVQIDGGKFEIETSLEGIESTSIQVNGGEIVLYALDDGINASQKSDLEVGIEINGGTIHITMGSGDTDAFDANGFITINDGIIDIAAGSAFDSDAEASLNGGTVTVNGEIITEITQQHMPGPAKSGGKNP